MADFTLNSPGTVNNPYTPANVIIPVGSLQSDATGFFPSGFVYVVLAHNATYGSTITATATLSALNPADQVYLGAVVRSGGNAGCHIGCRWDLNGSAVLQFTTAAGSATNISSGAASVTVSNGNTLSCTVSISSNVATVTAAINGTQITNFPGGNTVNSSTCAWVADSTLAAGGVLDPQNTNNTKLSQFTGTGVLAGVTITPTVGTDTIAGNSPTVTRATNTVIAPYVARRSGVLEPDRRLWVPAKRAIVIPKRKAA